MIRIAEHLHDLVVLISEEVGCTHSDAIDAIVEDWFDRPRADQPRALLSALSRVGTKWQNCRRESAEIGRAIDSVREPKTAAEYLRDLSG